MSETARRADPPLSLTGRIGIPRPLLFGFIGFTFFMVGDGIELGYLSSFLTGRGVPQPTVTTLFTVYGLTGSISAWLSGALSDAISPRRVMWLGLVIWAVFEVGFLVFGIGAMNPRMMLVLYGLRGFGYPLFAYGFLCWVAAATPGAALGAAVGWFWFFSTLGLLTVAPLLASVAIPLAGEVGTFWLSLGIVVAGGLFALLGLDEPTGKRPLAPPGERPFATLIGSVTILWRQPKASLGAFTRMINTASFYGFMPVMPGFFTHRAGFTLPQWLHLLSIVFFSNIIGNLVAGMLGDRIGHRKTIVVMGGLVCAISVPLFYFIPLWFPGDHDLVILDGIAWGIGLAGYVPLSALMPLISPRHKGAMIASLSLGAGASMWFGPLMFTLFGSVAGLGGVCLIFSGLYVLTMGTAALLRPETDDGGALRADITPPAAPLRA